MMGDPLGVNAIKFIDRHIGIMLVYALYLLSLPFRRKNFRDKRILAIQLWGIGETVCTLPALKALRGRFRDSAITVLATERNKDVYEGQESVDELVVLNANVFGILRFMLKNIRRFDLVVDFEEYLNISTLIGRVAGRYMVGFAGQPRSILFDKKVRYNDRQHVVQTHLDVTRLVGADINAEKLGGLHYSKDDEGAVLEMLEGAGIKRQDLVAGIAAGAAESSRSRIWPKERFAGLADTLSKKYNAKIVFVGSKSEVQLVDDIISLMDRPAVNLAGRTSVKQLFSLVKRFRIFISNDTGPMHIAAAQGVKTIGLFGPNLPARWAPYGRGNISIYRGKVCRYSPCINVHLGEVPECRYGLDNRCMKSITTKDVADAAGKIIG